MVSENSGLNVIIIEFILLAVVSYFLISYYKADNVTLDVIFTVYLSWVLGFVGILLIPYDISLSLTNQADGRLAHVWDFVYWSTFLLAWIILPIQAEYHSSGYFTPQSKFKDAIVKNLAFLGVAAALILLYIVYMVFSGEGSLYQIVNFLMALGNTYGIFIIIILMGSGLVGLPRRLWYSSDSEIELIRLYISSNSIEAAYQEARYELEECEYEVSKLMENLSKDSMNGELLKYGNIIQNKVLAFQFSGRSNALKYSPAAAARSSNGTAVDNDIITMKNVVELHAKVIATQIKARACERRWKLLIKMIKKYEILVNGGGPIGKTSTSDSNDWCEMATESSLSNSKSLTNVNGISSRLLKSAQYLFQVINGYTGCSKYLFQEKISKYFSRFLSVTAAGFSVVLLWSETTMATGITSPIAILINENVENNAGQAILFLFLTYMSICTYWSLFRINLGWAYTLQGPEQSPHTSLIFNGQYFSRLQFSLGYNFLMILNSKWTGDTSFNRLMSNIEIVPVFGTSFTVYIPILMIVISLITWFNGFSRIMRFIGIETDESSSLTIGKWKSGILPDDEKEKYETGKKLITLNMRQETLNAEIAGSNRKLLPMNNKSENDDGNTIAMPLRVTGSAMHRLTPFNSKNNTQFNPLAKQDHTNEDDDLEMNDDDGIEMGQPMSGSKRSPYDKLVKENNNWGLEDDEEDDDRYGGRYG